MQWDTTSASRYSQYFPSAQGPRIHLHLLLQFIVFPRPKILRPICTNHKFAIFPQSCLRSIIRHYGKFVHVIGACPMCELTNGSNDLLQCRRSRLTNDIFSSLEKLLPIFGSVISSYILWKRFGLIRNLRWKISMGNLALSFLLWTTPFVSHWQMTTKILYGRKLT